MIHSCSYYCERPECIKAQRDELRDRLAQPVQEPVAQLQAEKLQLLEALKVAARALREAGRPYRAAAAYAVIAKATGESK